MFGWVFQWYGLSHAKDFVKNYFPTKCFILDQFSKIGLFDALELPIGWVFQYNGPANEPISKKTE